MGEHESAEQAREEYQRALAEWRRTGELLKAAKEALIAAEAAERLATYKSSPKRARDLDLWQRWKAGEKLADLASSSGLSVSRVRSIVWHLDWKDRHQK